MQLGKFLAPEFCELIGLNLSHLTQLGPLTNRLDPKHQYEKVIFDSYISNGAYTLTDAQRLQAYEVYKSSRIKS